jgi:hypothetical protein
MSDKQLFVQGLLEAAMRARTNAWAVGDTEAAAKADKDVARLAAWLARLEPQPAPLVETGYHVWHSLLEHVPWLKRNSPDWRIWRSNNG